MLTFSLLSLLACTGRGGGKASEISLADANNYNYDASLTIVSVDVAPESQLDIDWASLSTDLLGAAVDPTADIDLVEIIGLTNHTQAETAQGLADGSVGQQDIAWAFDYLVEGGETAANTADFEISGALFDQGLMSENDNTTYMIRVATGEGATADNRMIIFVRPTTGSTNTTVAIGNDSTVLNFAVDLDALTHVAATTSSTSVEWTGLTTDGGGLPIDWTTVSQLWIASFDGMTSADLGDNFLGLESMYSDLYSVQMYGQDGMDLSTAVDASGNPFAGFTTDKTWVMALRCPDYCTNPAPPFFTLVDVTE